MASTDIKVGDRTFYMKVVSLKNTQGYRCYFHQRWMFGLGYHPGNKHTAHRQDAETVYHWFKYMVGQNLPADESAESVLNEAIQKLTEEFEEVEEVK